MRMGNNQSRRHPRYDTCTWETFIENIKEMNRNYRSLLVENGEYLTFALRRDSMIRDLHWKETIPIICCKVNIDKKIVASTKTLSFREFLSAYDIHKLLLTNRGARNQNADPMTTSQYIMTQTSDVEGNCVICMENVNDLLLPCLHAFCIRCIVAEMEYRTDFACPMCKTRIQNPIESSWEVPDVPNQDEVNEYLRDIGR